jgi:hypothetical protein
MSTLWRKIMNDQIRQLAEEARLGGGEFGNGVTYYVATEETFERFAQLIVDKCASLAKEKAQDRPYLYDLIKKHFE